jgi:hypothetical protein
MKHELYSVNDDRDEIFGYNAVHHHDHPISPPERVVHVEDAKIYPTHCVTFTPHNNNNNNTNNDTNKASHSDVNARVYERRMLTSETEDNSYNASRRRRWAMINMIAQDMPSCKDPYLRINQD